MKEVSIKVNRAIEDKMEILLSICGVDSYEIVDSEIYKEFSEREKNWDYIDESVMEQSEYISFKCYLDDSTELKNYIKSHADFEYELTEKDIKEADYENDWKKYFKPIKVSDSLIVEPKWDVHHENSVLINPGMAFGTGSHETKFLMLKEIDNIKPHGHVLDVGTGSGILAIACAKYFACKVDAYEIDDLAIKSAEENLLLNNVEDKINLFKKDFRGEEIKQYDYILSNIYAETLVDMMEGFSKRIKAGGKIILSGIVDKKDEIVEAAMVEKGFAILSKEKMNEWTRITGEYRG